MDNYYTKYLKYKNKYLELKRANGVIGVIGGGVIGGGGGVGSGGVGSVIWGDYLGHEPCPSTFGIYGMTTKSVWYYLRNYNCTFEDLNKKIPEKVDAITYTDFLRTNSEYFENYKITIEYLLFRGFPVEFLRERGFLEEIKKIKKVHEILYYLYSPNEIEKESGSLEKIKNYKFTIADFEISWSIPEKRLKILKRAGFSASELKIAGYSANTLKKTGFTFKELQEAEFPLTELKSAGFNAEELKKEGFTIRSLNQMGYTLQELKKAWITATQLKEAGYSSEELK
jgi:intracellular multiplication protein IcmE